MARSNKTIEQKYNTPFAANIRKLMDERAITQDVLAKAIGKTRQTVSQYANGISEPSYEALIKIANFFCVSTDFHIKQQIKIRNLYVNTQVWERKA